MIVNLGTPVRDTERMLINGLIQEDRTLATTMLLVLANTISPRTLRATKAFRDQLCVCD